MWNVCHLPSFLLFSTRHRGIAPQRLTVGVILSVALTVCVSAIVVKKGSAADQNDLAPERLSDTDIPNIEQAFITRRNRRLVILPAPPELPAPTVGALHPVDRFIFAKWQTKNTKRTDIAICDDTQFARRAYLDIIGTIPTVRELDRFLSNTAADKRSQLIDNLLARNDQYAAHYTTWWEDALASAKSTTFGGVITRGDYQSWIFESLRENTPYDLMVAELIDPALPGHKAPVPIDILGVSYKAAFLRDRSHTEILQSAADVAQVFLGTGMKCASCHDHFENSEWPQVRFLGFAGFFSPQDLEQIRCEESVGGPVSLAWPFEMDIAAQAVASDYEDRLHLAAQFLTDPHNWRFAETIVNRLWKRFLGTGLYEPVDDFRSNIPASHPDLLRWLANDFVRHRFDIKHTIRRILTSQTFQLQYNAGLADHFDLADRTAPRYFRSPSLRRLTAEQLLDSIRVGVTQQRNIEHRVFRAFHGRPNGLTRSLGRADTRGEVSTFRSGETAILQALEFINGQTYNRLVDFCLQPEITEETLIEDVNGAKEQGVQLGKVCLTGDGVSVEVDLSDAETLGDVTDRINLSMEKIKDPNVHSLGKLLLGEDGFVLNANPGHSLSIEDIGQAHIAADLGIGIRATSSPISGESIRPKFRLSAETDRVVAVVSESNDPSSWVTHVYQMLLSRHPSVEELSAGVTFLTAASRHRLDQDQSGELPEYVGDGLIDIFWALVTSPMFQYIY